MVVSSNLTPATNDYCPDQPFQIYLPALRDDFLRKGDDSETPQEIAPRIVVDPKVRSGKPVFQGARVPVELVIGKLAGGMTPEQVAQEYELELDDIKAALSYAANVLASEEIRGVS